MIKEHTEEAWSRSETRHRSREDYTEATGVCATAHEGNGVSISEENLKEP